MRRIRYQAAASLDGYIAGPRGEYDWIPHDPDIDFNALFAQFDTLLVGRRTFEGMASQGRATTPGMQTIVFSRTLKQSDWPDVTVVSDGVADTVAALKQKPGKDMWLFGGGELFRSLLELGLVDSVEPAIVPILLGGGTPLLPQTNARTTLVYRGQRLYTKSGILLVEYSVRRT